MTRSNQFLHYRWVSVLNTLCRIGLLVFFLMAQAFADNVDDFEETLKIGLLPDSAQKILDSRFGPLLHYIEDETGLRVEYKQSKDYLDLLNQFKEKELDAVFFGGYTFILAQQGAGAEPLVLRDNDLHFNTVFLVRPGSIEKRLRDYKDAVISFGSRQSTSGHLMPRYFLDQQSIHPENFFSKVLYSGSHDKTAYWVRDGIADIGAANSQVIKRMLREGDLQDSDIQILWQTPDYTDYVWAIQPDMEPSLRVRLLDAFLSLSPLNPEHEHILESAGAGGFLPAHDADFDLLRNVVRTLRSEMQ
ncbi:phosphate/phosphite/phosphonate ABC transporter substrate-binding protein [Nitrosomonas marina]|uniref:Phosphonate transport system substrate-binding protein n=1 Tax=Nitrosomonas marina TaxID=917 RepID=A0A1H8DAJ9_9PROT|nr:phosphate/phosphite/phosphonate ABC transporter substrate-binding protein [Nitrosomonas marina]SEN04279.1 phosphonate transport system substrate-binding protein [Nitrosomonas marina]